MTERVAPIWSLGILAGGYSTRMGRDKASLPFGDVTLLDHVRRRLVPDGVPARIATRPDGPGRDAGLPWVPDVLPGEGPLSGIAALLQDAPTPFVLVVPCDAPCLPSDLGDRLLSCAPSVDAVLLSDAGRVQPLPALLSRDLGPVIAGLLAAGERKAAAYVDRVPCAIVPFDRLWPGLDPAEALMNVNDEPALLRALRAGGAR